MSHGSCVAALDGAAAPPASSAPAARVAAAAAASSGRRANLSRGLTVIVEPALPFPLTGDGLAGTVQACGQARADGIVSDHNISYL
jgi:hypothetical protein